MIIPTAIWSGTFTLLGVELRCHTLSDGQRIIEAESFDKFMAAMNDPEAETSIEELNEFAMWRMGE